MPEKTPGQMVCPACHVACDRIAILAWGDGQQRLPVAPWICASCAALGMIQLATGHITLTDDRMWQAVRDRNPVLWHQIVATRAQIRGAHTDA